jgi:MFS family permease
VMGVEPHQRGRILAVFTGAFYMGFAGTSFLGPLAGAAGYRAVFWVAGATTAAGVVLLARSRALGAKRGYGRAEVLLGSEPIEHV